MTILDLHIGLRTQDIDITDLILLVDEYAVTSIYVNGDNWDEWGEPCSTDPTLGFDATIQHVVIRFDSDETPASLLMGHVTNGLPCESMSLPWQDGTLAVVTDWEDWSIVRLSLTAGR